MLTEPPLWGVKILLVAATLSVFGGSYYANKTEDLPINEEVQPTAEDTRVTKIESYLESYGSPYYWCSQTIVDSGDAYGIDPYLLVAIFIKESSGGRHCIANNCMGWGVYGGNYIPFDSVVSGFEVVAKNLAQNPYYQGRDNYEKMITYNGVAYANRIMSLTETIKNYDSTRR